jgi:hypothetical protein
MPKQTPEDYILLSEAVILTGKNDSTIRRFFKRPENKPYTTTKDNKVYVDKTVLLKQYGPPKQAPKQTPGTPEQNVSTVDAALQALINQLDAKDRQIEDLNARLKESNINLNVAMQRLQLQESNPQKEAPQQQTQTPGTPEQTPKQRRSWFARMFS